MADSLLPGSVKDSRFLLIEQILERISNLDLSVLDIYNIDSVNSEALYDLADSLDVLGYKGWILADTEAKQRQLIKNSIALHKIAGTPQAIINAMATVGFPSATVTENPPLAYDGSWMYDGTEYYAGKKLGAFIVTLDPVAVPVNQQQITLIIALINAWKNRRSHLIDLRVGSRSLLSNLLIYDGSWAYDGSQEYDAKKN